MAPAGLLAMPEIKPLAVTRMFVVSNGEHATR